jgi:hypothetical protein
VCGQQIIVPEQTPVADPEPARPEPPIVKRPIQEQPADEPLFQPVPDPVVPVENRPLSPWGYFGYSILFSIPVIGFILLIVFSFAGRNVNRKNYARSYWCWFILVLALALILVIVLLTGVLRGVTDSIGMWLDSVGLHWLAGLFR